MGGTRHIVSVGLACVVAGCVPPAAQAKPDTGTNSSNHDVIAASMTDGQWGGFDLGIMMTKDSPPDPKFGAAKTPKWA